jgi:poly(3-hydroxybutyrate) depolymerase
VKASVVEEKESRRTTRVSPAPLQRFDRLKDFPGLNLRGPMTALRLPRRISHPKARGSSQAPSAARMESRNYKLFVPGHSQEEPLPLVVMLHGCTQSPDDFAAGTRMNFLAEERNCFVVYPEQPSVANQAKC